MTSCHCATFQKDHGAGKVLQMTVMLLGLRYRVSLQKDFTLKIFDISVQFLVKLCILHALCGMEVLLSSKHSHVFSSFGTTEHFPFPVTRVSVCLQLCIFCGCRCNVCNRFISVRLHCIRGVQQNRSFPKISLLS